MQVLLPHLDVPATIVLDSDEPLPLEAYLAICKNNPDLRLERSAEGEIIIVPPCGGESGYREAETISALTQWARRNGRGRSFSSSTEFVLPDGACRCADAAWISKEKLAKLSRADKREFLRIVPEFVIEVMSRTDRLQSAKRKMEQDWIGNGVQLGWLIQPSKKKVYVYRPGQPAEEKTGLTELAGEGPVEGFVLNLTYLWEEI